MRRGLQITGVVVVTTALILVNALGALIGLSAECTGSTKDCPHSDAWRAAVLATPVATVVLLIAGAAWSLSIRRLWPLVLAVAAVLALDALVDAVLDTPDLGTAVLLAASLALGGPALKRA